MHQSISCSITIIIVTIIIFNSLERNYPNIIHHHIYRQHFTHNINKTINIASANIIIAYQKFTHNNYGNIIYIQIIIRNIIINNDIDEIHYYSNVAKNINHI